MSRIEILSAPDSKGRVIHIKRWRVENPAYCLTCGKSQERNCSCYELLKERGQYFFDVLPKEERE